MTTWRSTTPWRGHHTESKKKDKSVDEAIAETHQQLDKWINDPSSLPGQMGERAKAEEVPAAAAPPATTTTPTATATPITEDIDSQIEATRATAMKELETQREKYLADIQEQYGLEPGQAGRPLEHFLMETRGEADIAQWYEESKAALAEGIEAQREVALGGAGLEALGKDRRSAQKVYNALVDSMQPKVGEQGQDFTRAHDVGDMRPAYVSEAGKAVSSDEPITDKLSQAYKALKETTEAEYKAIGTREQPGAVVESLVKYGAPEEQVSELLDYGEALGQQISDMVENLGTPEEYAQRLREQQQEEMPEGWLDRWGWAWESGGGFGKVGRSIYFAGLRGDKWIDPATRYVAEEIDNPWSAALYEAYTYLPGYQRGEEQFREAGGTPEILSLGGIFNPVAWGRGTWEAAQSGDPLDLGRSMGGIMFRFAQTERQREKTEIYKGLGEPAGWGLSFTHPLWVASMFVGAGEAKIAGQWALRGISKTSVRLQATELVSRSSKLTNLVKGGELAAGAPIKGVLWSGEVAGRRIGAVKGAAKAPFAKVFERVATTKVDDAVLRAAKRKGLEILRSTSDLGGVKHDLYQITAKDGSKILAQNPGEVAHYVQTGQLFSREIERHYVPEMNRILSRAEVDELRIAANTRGIFPETTFRYLSKPAVDGLTDDLWAQGINAFATDNLVKSMHFLDFTRIPKIELSIDVALQNTRAKQLVGKFAGVPGLRRMINKIDPNTFVTKDDKILAAAAGWHQMGATWEMVVKGKMAPVRSMEKLQVKVVEEGGLTKPIVQNVRPLKEGVEAYVGDVVEHPEWFEMSEHLRATINSMHQMIDEAKAALNKYGININELGFEEGGHYFPRYVLGKKIVQSSFKGGRGIMTKGKFEKTRMFDTMKEGIEEGYVYLENPLQVLETHLMTVGRRIADAEFARMVRPMGLTRNEMVELMAPGLARTVSGLKDRWKHYERVLQLVRRAERGEHLPGASLGMVQRYDPGIARALSAAREGTPNKSFWSSLKDDATLKESRAKAEFYTKQAELHKVIETAKSQPPWGRDLTSKAKPQIQKWLKEGKDPETYEPLRRLQELVRRAEGFDGTTARRVESYAFSGTWFPEQTAKELDSILGQATNKWVSLVSDVNALSRFMMTGMDWGAPMIQGLPLLALNPPKWAEAVGRSLQVFGASMVGRGDTAYASFFAKEANQSALAEIASAGRSIVLGGTEFTEAAARRGLAGKTVGRVPGLGRLSRSYANSFEMFGDVARIELYKSLRHMATTPAQVAELADFVNKATGVTSSKALGIPASQRQIEGAIFLFSPRYFRASMALTSDMMRGGLRGSLAREALGSLAASALIFYYASCKALGQEPSLDPRSGKFLTWEIGGNHIGVGSIWTANARLLGNIYRAASDSPEDFLDWRVWEQEARRDNPLWRYLSGRVAPLTGTGLDIITGKNYIGEPLDTPYDYFEECIAGNILPFWIDAQIFEDPRPGLSAVPAEIFGMRSWALQPWETRNKLRDEYAMKEFGATWQQLVEERPKDNTSKLWGKAAREHLLKVYPDLKDAELEARERRVERGEEVDRLLQAYFDDRDRAREERGREYNLAVSQFAAHLKLKQRLLEGDPTLTQEEIAQADNAGFYFKERVKAADKEYRDLLAARETDPKYDPVRALFDEWHEGDNEKEFVGDKAYDDWCSLMYGNDVLYDEFGNYLHDKADELVLQFKAKWGTKWYDYVQSLIQSRKDEPTLVRQYRDASKYLGAYWDLEKKYQGLYSDITQDEIRAHQDQQVLATLQAQAPSVAGVYQQMQANPAFAEKVRASSQWSAIYQYIEAVREPIRSRIPTTLTQVVDAAKLQWRLDHEKGEEYLELFYDMKPLGDRTPAVTPTYPREVAAPRI